MYELLNFVIINLQTLQVLATKPTNHNVDYNHYRDQLKRAIEEIYFR